MSKRYVGRACRNGFTLIELMAAITIAAILMTIAVPSFLAFQRSSELTSAANGLVAAVAAARGEAMKNGMHTMVVPADGTRWASGWVVFVDKDRDQAFKESADNVVAKQTALPGYFTVIASSGSTAAEAAPYISFDASGYPKTKSGAFATLTMSIAPNDLSDTAALNQTRRVVVSASGRVRSCRPASATDAKCAASSVE